MRGGETGSLPAAFGEHLLRSRIAEERHARYYVGRVRRFPGKPGVMPNATPDEALTGFLDGLEREDRRGEQARKARIPKPVTPHTPRHSFTTHLPLSNVGSRRIQGLPGHRSVGTASICTHVVKDLRTAPRSSSDAL